MELNKKEKYLLGGWIISIVILFLVYGARLESTILGWSDTIAHFFFGVGIAMILSNKRITLEKTIAGALIIFLAWELLEISIAYTWIKEELTDLTIRITTEDLFIFFPLNRVSDLFFDALGLIFYIKFILLKA